MELGNKFAPLFRVRHSDPSLYDSNIDNVTLLLNYGNYLDIYQFQPAKLFHSIDSESSIVKNIKALGVGMTPSSLVQLRAMVVRILPLLP